jgi:hypothetical protein
MKNENLFERGNHNQEPPTNTSKGAVNKQTLFDNVKHLPHDAYWDGVCTRCGRMRRLCEALRQKLWKFRCQEIKEGAL